MSAPAEAGTAFCLYSTTKLSALALDANARHITAARAHVTPRSVKELPLLPRIEPPSHRSRPLYRDVSPQRSRGPKVGPYSRPRGDARSFPRPEAAATPDRGPRPSRR